MKHQAKPLLLVFPFGLLSHYLRCIVIAKHLSPYFKIKFASHPQYNHFVTHEGFTLFDYQHADEKIVMQKVKKFDFSWMSENNLESSFTNQVDVIRKYEPVAVLGDAMPTLKMAGEYTGTHYISLINTYMSLYYQNIRNISRSHPAYHLVNNLPVKLKNYLTTKGEAIAFKHIHKAFNRLRDKYSLRQQENYLYELQGDQTLLCDTEQLFPTDELPLSVTQVGPLIYKNHSIKNNLPPLSPDKKTIFVSMGSSGNWKNVSFLNDEFYSRFNIITACDTENIIDAPHIIKAGFVDADTIFPSVDLLICHGGNGTIYQALQHGIPLLCKTVHFEQEWNVCALEKAGLALSLDGITDKDQLQNIISHWITLKGKPAYQKVKTDIDIATAALGSKFAAIAQQADCKIPSF